jgi:HD-GYP domain-containing protein (c-di-GMP phosphodiesterase class II)
MYVVELDRPWLGTPFPFQGFPITSQDEIETLRSLCRKVFIDPERTRWTGGTGLLAGGLGGAGAESVALGKAVHLARKVHESCEQTLQQLLDEVRLEGKVDAPKLSLAVTSMTESIQRNPDAMLLLNRLRQKGSYELTRAMDTSILMITFGRFLQYPKERLEILGLAGLLLDVGKAKLPPGDDDPGRAHVLHSIELLRNTEGIPKGLEEIVALHHEQPDGKGLPHGLSEDAISTDGAIAALIDAFSELTTARPGYEPVSSSNALQQLYNVRGASFPTALVEQFIQCIGIYPVGTAVELNTREVAIVIAQNLVRRLQPRVMVIFDEKRELLNPQKMLDLVKKPMATAEEPYRIQRALARNALPIDPAEFFL